MFLRRLALLLALPFIGSCSSAYDLLIHDQFKQGSFDSDVDILWVVDNSNSMSRIQQEVQQNFGAFISSFANIGAEDGTELDYDNVADGTVAWAEFITNQSRFLNYQMAVTTTDMFGSGNGNRGNLRSLADIGNGTCDAPEIITPASDNPVGVFQDLVDVGVNGSGEERGMHAAAVAMCKGKPESWWNDVLPNLADDDPVKLICQAVPANERGCNDGFFREGAATVVIVISDEGDDTERQEQLPPAVDLNECILEHNDDPFFGECDCRISWWIEFFDNIGQPVVFATIGPTYQQRTDPVAWCDGTDVTIDGPCNPFGNTVCSIDFYQNAACLTNGLFTPIEVGNDAEPGTPEFECGTADFQLALTDVGKLISNLNAGWVLSAIPDESTITVIKNQGFSDEVVIEPLSENLSTGWRYVPDRRSLVFSGADAPSFEEQIDVYYLPQFDRTDQVGRDLPF